MKADIIDTHAHLDMKSFDEDRDQTIARSQAAGVVQIVNIGIDLESSRQSIELAKAYPHIYATVGFHPHDAGKMKQSDTELMTEMARHPKVVGLGEMGLDFYRNISPREVQVQALQWQLELALKLSLPVVIHSREAAAETISMLTDWIQDRSKTSSGPPGVVHCFSGDVTTAEKYLSLGFYIAIGAYIGYPASRELREIVKHIPEDRLVVETDCPFLPPQAYRSRRNEPSYLPLTIKTIAVATGRPPDEVAAATTRNALRLFQLPEVPGHLAVDGS